MDSSLLYENEKKLFTTTDTFYFICYRTLDQKAHLLAPGY